MTQYLLDTNVFLWLQTDPGRIGRVLERLAASDSERLVSVASIWEISIKFGLGKLPLPAPPEQYVPAHLRATAAASLPVAEADALAVASLPPHHGDPFDRMLVVQAMRRDLTLVTGDARLTEYAVDAILV